MNKRHPWVSGFDEPGREGVARIGGKGANLSELLQIDELNVPPGFCVTTDAFREVTGNSAGYQALLRELCGLEEGERMRIVETSAKIRKVIAEIPIPEYIADAIGRRLEQLGKEDAYAVRSSATAEDLPGASFAGQQETYLNIVGRESILRHVSHCWASLFTERAVIYRIRNGFDHQKVCLAVVIQKMVFADAAGVMFTADPVTSNRKVVSIDAGFGLGEAVVAGLVNADNYQVRQGRIAERRVSAKTIAVVAVKGGGTIEQEIAPGKQQEQVLTDEQVLELEGIGRRIERHFGTPQDIEWCLAEGRFYLVQSRPITTVYPIPDAPDHDNRVYLSVGHQQMMTDAMKPLGLSCWLLLQRGFMRAAGGRLFVDVTHMLASAAERTIIIDVLGKFDPLIRDALATIVEREGFIKPAETDGGGEGTVSRAAPMPDYQALNEYDPAIVSELIADYEAALESLKQHIGTTSGAALFEVILADIQQLKTSTTNPRSLGVIFTAMNAAAWINDKMNQWLGEENAADTISQSAPGNVTSEMGLALLEVADVIRPYREIVDYLKSTTDEHFLEVIASMDGGGIVRDAFQAFLNRYGMRCAGEIDITRPRWSEKPLTLIPAVLTNIRNFEPGASRRKFEEGLKEARRKEQDLLDRLRQLRDGEEKAKEARQMIDLVRNYSGYREYPKYAIVNRFFVYKQALLREAGQLVRTGVIHDFEDIYFLTFDELREVVRTRVLDYRMIDRRKEEHRFFERLTPPRVMTSDGEIVRGKYRREGLPAEALAGQPVSAGVAEGRARVILKMEDADLETDDILVTTFTDPSWTPLFVAIRGLVTEVGGPMTHGAVIAREYGLPAVVGVENATRLIKDGQRIRVNGTAGIIEVL